MAYIKTQTGVSVTADFSENTWTFQMPDGYKVSAGQYVIIDKDTYIATLEAIFLLSIGLNRDRTAIATTEEAISIARSAIQIADYDSPFNKL